MPATRSRSRSPRRSSALPYSKDKAAKPNSRELITIKTEGKDDGKKDNKLPVSSKESKNASDSSKPKTSTTSAKDSKPGEKTYRKPPESSKGGNAGNWNSSNTRTKERKFSGRCRLFVGNLVSCGEEELKGMFEKYGEVAEAFVNKDKGFGFVRLVSK